MSLTLWCCPAHDQKARIYSGRSGLRLFWTTMTAILALLAKLPMWLYILVFALSTIGIQQWRIHHAHAQLTALQGVANTLSEANQTNVATIVALRATNDKWARENAANLANAKVYADAAMEYAKQQQAAAESANAKLRAIYAQQPVVKAWADTAVPADVRRVLASSGQN